MAKSELSNIKNLLKVRMKIQRKEFMWFFVLMAIFLTASLTTNIVSIVQNTRPGLSHHNMMDFSTAFFFGGIIAYVVTVFLYRKVNDTLSMYPQTNTGRFISTQLINHINVALYGLAMLVAYLLSYGVIWLLSVFHGNVYFALQFSWGFVAAGYVTFVMYLSLVAAATELIGAIYRKWTYYAVIAYAVLLSLAITNLETLVARIPRALAFLIREPSFGLFLLKAVGLWLGIIAVSLIINFFTVYHKVKVTTITKRIAIICTVFAVLIVGVASAAMSIFSNEPVHGTMTGNGVIPITDFFEGAEEIRIDISHLPRGSNINLAGENIDHDSRAGGMAVRTGPGTAPNAFVSGQDALLDIQGDTLVIQTRLPFLYVNGIDMMRHANPRVYAYLRDNTLYVDFIVDTVDVVLIPVWGIARQFDAFRDQDLLTAHLLGGSRSGSMSANIFIRVE